MKNSHTQYSEYELLHALEDKLIQKQQMALWTSEVSEILPRYDHISQERLKECNINTVAELAWAENRESLEKKNIHRGLVVHLMACLENNGLQMNMRQQMIDDLEQEKRDQAHREYLERMNKLDSAFQAFNDWKKTQIPEKHLAAPVVSMNNNKASLA